MWRKCWWLVVVLGCGYTVNAQTKSNLWTRLTLQTKLTDKWEAALELQHRRQQPDNEHLFSRPLMYSVRPWIHYKLNPHFSLSVSPLAWYRQYPVLLTEKDVSKASMQEWRGTLAGSYQTTVLPQINFQSRVAVEYRNFSTGQQVLRTRIRTGFQYTLPGEVSLNAYNELMLNPTGAAPGHFLDQDRQSISAMAPISQGVAMEVGYMHIYRKLPTYDPIIQEHNYFVQLNISLPHISKFAQRN